MCPKEQQIKNFHVGRFLLDENRLMRKINLERSIVNCSHSYRYIFYHILAWEVPFFQEALRCYAQDKARGNSFHFFISDFLKKALLLQKNISWLPLSAQVCDWILIRLFIELEGSSWYWGSSFIDSTEPIAKQLVRRFNSPFGR